MRFRGGVESAPANGGALLWRFARAVCYGFNAVSRMVTTVNFTSYASKQFSPYLMMIMSMQSLPITRSEKPRLVLALHAPAIDSRTLGEIIDPKQAKFGGARAG